MLFLVNQVGLLEITLSLLLLCCLGDWDNKRRVVIFLSAFGPVVVKALEKVVDMSTLLQKRSLCSHYALGAQLAVVTVLHVHSRRSKLGLQVQLHLFDHFYFLLFPPLSI